MSNVYQAPQADLTPKPKRVNERNPVTQEMIDNLANGCFWAKFMAILGYISAGFLVLAPIVTLFTTGIMGAIIIMGAFFIIAAFVVVKMSNFLLQYSRSVKMLQETGDIGDMLDAQEYFAKYMKWAGVIVLLMAVLIVVGLFAGLLMH